MTGGGPAVPDPTDLESKVLLVIGQDSVEGFDGWIDTGVTVPNTPACVPAPAAATAGDEIQDDVGLRLDMPQPQEIVIPAVRLP